MSDKQFSVDDILNEYSKKRDNTSKSMQNFDVDEFLRDTKPPHKNEKIQSNKETTFPSFIPPMHTTDRKKEEIQIPPTKKVTSSVATIEKTLSPVLPVKINKETPTDIKPAPSNAENISKAEQRRQTSKQLNADNDYSNRSATGFGGVEPEKIPSIKPIRKSSGNTEIINNLLKLRKERVLNKTSELTPVTRKNINDITLDIKSKIIPKTEQIELPDNATDEEREAYLAKQRSKKIKDFVLTDIDDELPADEETKDDDDFEDFRTIEDAPVIHKSIVSLKASLSGRLFLLSVLFIITTYLVVANDYSMPVFSLVDRTQNPVTYLFVITILGLFGAISCFSVIINGLRNLFTLKADSDSLCALAIITSLISSTALINNSTLFRNKALHVYIPVALGALIFNTIGKIMLIKRTEKNFDFVSSDGDKYSLFKVTDEKDAENFTKGTLNDIPDLTGIKKTEFVTDFLKNSYSEDISDHYSKIVVPVIFLVSLIVSALSVIFTKDTKTGVGLTMIALSNLAGTIALCSSFALPLTVNYPMHRASKRYLESSAALIGYNAVEDYKDSNSVIISASQLFPEGSVDFVNLKQLSSTTIEEGILVAASLASHADSLLKAPFYKMLKGKTEMLYPVDSYVFEDSLGISGWIENKRVLLGNRALMENHSIEGLPTKEKEKKYAKDNTNIVYLSISGEVTTLFIVKTRASIGITRWLHEMEKNNIAIILHCVDSFISLNGLSLLFDVSPDCFKLLPFRFHEQYDKETSYVPRIESSLLCSGRFQSLAMVITGAKRIYRSAVMGLSFTLISTIVACLLSISMAVLTSFSELTCVNVLLYNLAFTAVIFFLQSVRKS